MAESPVLYVYYRPANDDAYPGVPGRHITEADWARFSPSQRRTVEQATTQEGYTRRKVWLHRDLVDETEQERAEREAAEQAAREAYERGSSLVRYREFSKVVPGPGEVIVGGEDGPVARTLVGLRARLPVRIAALGDSITGDGLTPAHWVGWATLLSGGALVQSGTGWASGVGGNTTAQMLARVGSVLALDPKPDICVVGGGTNDVSRADYSLAATTANLVAIYDRLRTAGIEPVAVLIPPKVGTGSDRVAPLNAWIGAYAWANGMACLDFYTMNATGTGAWRAGLSSDGTHPTPTAAKAMGEHAASVLGGGSTIVPMLARPSDTANLVPNGVFVEDADGDGLADGWGLLGDGTGAPSLVPGTGDVLGNWQKVTVTTAGQRYISGNLSGWGAGDLLLFCGRLRLENVAGGFKVDVRLQATGSSMPALTFGWDQPLDVTFAKMARVPAGTTAISVRVIGSSTGTGEFSLAQWTVRNLTAMGLA